MYNISFFLWPYYIPLSLFTYHMCSESWLLGIILAREPLLSGLQTYFSWFSHLECDFPPPPAKVFKFFKNVFKWHYQMSLVIPISERIPVAFWTRPTWLTLLLQVLHFNSCAVPVTQHGSHITFTWTVFSTLCFSLWFGKLWKPGNMGLRSLAVFVIQART